MAKRTKNEDRLPLNDSDVPAPMAAPLSTKVATLVDTLRIPFRAFVDGFESLTTARAELAPKFMKAFGAWTAETGGTFVGFVREMDPTVPESREGYRSHKAYQAADYLRRLSAPGRLAREPVPLDQRPVTPLVALSRLVATVLVPLDTTGSIYAAWLRECHWSDEQGERLKALAQREGPVKLAPRVKHQLVRVA